jgi:hypothetical protein
MRIDYLRLKYEITKMGSEARAREAGMQSALKAMRALLNSRATDLSALQELVEKESAKTKGLRCAVPLEEPLNAHISCTLPAPPCTILAADGSQINPDPHNTVLYGLVNIGVFRMQPGSGLAPQEITDSSLIHGDALYAGGATMSEDLVALLRDVREREILAKLAARELAPILTLTDGPLELYHEPRQEQKFKVHFEHYLSALADLALNEVVTAGYVSRPRADLVVKLLTLLNHEASDETEIKPAGLTDIALFSNLLAPGERSAVFRLQSSSAADYKGRAALHFFYLNAGTAQQPAFARVEIPQWVVENPNSVNLLHAVLVEQARNNPAAPYPYPLLRAHEIAVVRLPERQQVTSMIEAELLRQGFPPVFKSQKQVNKEYSGTRRMGR